MKRLPTLLAAVALGTVALGLLQHHQGAGLACPDLPLCGGQLLPPPWPGAALAWSHRVLGALWLLLAALVLRAPGRQAALPLVTGLLTAAAGAWMLSSALSPASQAAHASLSMLTLAATGALLAPARALPARLPGGLALLGIALTLLAMIQVSTLGAERACPSFPQCLPGSWFPTWRGPIGAQMRLRIAEILAVLSAGAWLWQTAREKAATGLPALLFATILIMVALGTSNVLLPPGSITGPLSTLLASALALIGGALLRQILTSE